MQSFADNFIAGTWSPATGAGRTTLTNPTTETEFAVVHHASADDVDAAVAAAQKAFPAWSAVLPAERANILDRCMEEIKQRSEDFIACMTSEVGIPTWLGRRLLLPMPLQNGAVAIETIRTMDWSEYMGPSLVSRVPVGVMAAITPWNAPLHQIVAKVIAALAAGCTVVLKASEIAPTTAILFADALKAAGLPAGAFNLIWGGAETGAALCSHPGTDMISFTGSERVGLAVAELAGRHGKRVVLELGGKSAALICADAPLDRAIPAVLTSCFASSGQTCVAQTRLLVPEQMVEAVKEICARELDSWTCGDPAADGTRLGPVATRRQQKHIQDQLTNALSEGATALQSQSMSLPDKGFFVPPTVLFDVTPSMAVAQHELFGPVLSVIAYRNEDEAVTIANGTAYGLSGSVWTGDRCAGVRLAQRIKTGQVSVNGAPQNFQAPFGGVKRSGYGRENGRFGVEECLQYHVVHGAMIVD